MGTEPWCVTALALVDPVGKLVEHHPAVGVAGAEVDRPCGALDPCLGESRIHAEVVVGHVEGEGRLGCDLPTRQADRLGSEGRNLLRWQ